MSQKDEILREIAELDLAPVECDGFASLVVTLLDRYGEDYTPYCGSVSNEKGEVFSPHLWVQWNGCIIDYRAKMWLNDTAPHGVNPLSEVESLYDGEPIQIEPLAPFMEQILKMPFDMSQLKEKT